MLRRLFTMQPVDRIGGLAPAIETRAFRVIEAEAIRSFSMFGLLTNSTPKPPNNTTNAKVAGIRLLATGLVILSFNLYAAANLEVPRITPIPPSDRAPLASANRPGTEYADLAAAGYVEEEYFLHGVAPAITAAGETLFDAPYITRILVRKPKDPAKFNGTVVIAPFTWIGERGAGWILTKDYLLRKGYAWVGYTLNINKPEKDPKTHYPELWDPAPDNLNFEFMRKYDYARYASLGFYYDPKRFLRDGHPDQFVPQSQAVGAQLAMLLKQNNTQGPLPGLDVERVYVNSWAVTAQVWMDYLNQGRHQQWRMPGGAQLIDAYMVGKMEFGSLGGPTNRIPKHPPEDAPFVNVYTQSELMVDTLAGIPAPKDSDSPPIRFYELAGTPHMRPADLGTEEIELMPSDIGKEDDPNCNTLYDDEPEDALASALLERMDQWVRNNVVMPRADRVQRKNKKLVRDAKTNNIIGGVRPPWITVPAAAYMTEQETGCGLLYDTKIVYSAAKLIELYESYDNYIQQFNIAKQDSIKQGYLLEGDANKVKPIAKPEDFNPSATNQ